MSASKRKSSKTVVVFGGLGNALKAALEKSLGVLETIDVSAAEKPVLLPTFPGSRMATATPKFRWPLDMPASRPRVQASAYEFGRIAGEAAGASVLSATDVERDHNEWLGEEIVCYLNGVDEGVLARL